MNVLVEFPLMFMVGFAMGGLLWVAQLKYVAIRGALNSAMSD
jgi:hypothetical protein